MMNKKNRDESEDKFYAALSEYMRLARQERGMRQAEMARKLGCATSTLSHVENGTRVPSMWQVYRFATVLELSLDEIVMVSQESALNPVGTMNYKKGSIEKKLNEVSLQQKEIIRLMKELQEDGETL